MDVTYTDDGTYACIGNETNCINIHTKMEVSIFSTICWNFQIE